MDMRITFSSFENTLFHVHIVRYQLTSRSLNLYLDELYADLGILDYGPKYVHIVYPRVTNALKTRIKWLADRLEFRPSREGIIEGGRLRFYPEFMDSWLAPGWNGDLRRPLPAAADTEPRTPPSPGGQEQGRDTHLDELNALGASGNDVPTPPGTPDGNTTLGTPQLRHLGSQGQEDVDDNIAESRASGGDDLPNEPLGTLRSPAVTTAAQLSQQMQPPAPDSPSLWPAPLFSGRTTRRGPPPLERVHDWDAGIITPPIHFGLLDSPAATSRAADKPTVGAARRRLLHEYKNGLGELLKLQLRSRDSLANAAESLFRGDTPGSSSLATEMRCINRAASRLQRQQDHVDRSLGDGHGMTRGGVLGDLLAVGISTHSFHVS
ncbi:hypothetical protein Ct61P_15154 [Colletotrichum tofieldiae]|nr:hypothetical protein Ct61P_15154 [Colletotrichum tofieldiae]